MSVFVRVKQAYTMLLGPLNYSFLCVLNSLHVSGWVLLGELNSLLRFRAGVGRTGTFIGLDILLHQKFSKTIDDCIALVRNQRPLIVQVMVDRAYLQELIMYTEKMYIL